MIYVKQILSKTRNGSWMTTAVLPRFNAFIKQHTVDASMSTICPSPLLHGSVDLDVLDVHGINIQPLHLQLRYYENLLLKLRLQDVVLTDRSILHTRWARLRYWCKAYFHIRKDSLCLLQMKLHEPHK